MHEEHKLEEIIAVLRVLLSYFSWRTRVIFLTALSIIGAAWGTFVIGTVIK